MKFGQQILELVEPKFRNYTVAYDNLKGYLQGGDNNSRSSIQTIRDVTSATVAFLPGAQADELPSMLFQEALTNELTKVNTFCELEEEALVSQLRGILRTLQDLEEHPSDSPSRVASIRSTLDEIADDIVGFDVFIRLNYTAFRKITKKEAKVHKTSSAAWFMANVTRAKFMSVDFDRLVTLLSICYTLVRASSESLHEAPPTDSYPLHKNRVVSGWVSDETLVEVKVALARACTLSDVTIGSETNHQHGFTKMVSEYYDTPSLEIFKRKNDGGFQVDYNGRGEVIVALPSGEDFSVPGKSWRIMWDGLAAQMKNVPGIDSLDPNAASELSELSQSGVRVLSRCEYRRYMFRSDLVDVVVDEGAVFLDPSTNEELEDCGRFSKFPANVIYIYSRSQDSERPEWLSEITGMAGVTEVPMFSKRGHGLLLKYFAQADVASFAHAVPAWFVAGPKSADTAPSMIAKPVIDNRAASPVTSPVLTGIAMPDRRGQQWVTRLIETISTIWHRVIDGPAEEEKIKLKDIMVKIEPKSFFSCERNLLDWMHTCVVLTGVAVLVARRISYLGQLVSLLAVFMLLAQVRLFRRRNHQMLHKEGTEFDDTLGPPMLFACILLLSLDLFLDAILGLYNMSE